MTSRLVQTAVGILVAPDLSRHWGWNRPLKIVGLAYGLLLTSFSVRHARWGYTKRVHDWVIVNTSLWMSREALFVEKLSFRQYYLGCRRVSIFGSRSVNKASLLRMLSNIFGLLFVDLLQFRFQVCEP